MHRVDKPAESTCRAIVSKFSACATKELVLRDAKKEKLREISVYQDFSKEAVAIWKKNW